MSLGAPLAMLLARPVFLYAAHGLTTLVLLAVGVPHPWSAAAPWWTVYGTLADLGCLFALRQLLRSEQLTPMQLVGFQRHRLARDLCLGGLCLLGFGALTFVGSALAGVVCHVDARHVVPIGGLPLWATVYSLIVWPWLWGFAEEATYNGYALPRLAKRLRWTVAGLLVSLAWAGQHVALPAIFEARFMAFRFLSTLPVALLATAIYARTRRLVPLIAAHSILDALAPLSALLSA